MEKLICVITISIVLFYYITINIFIIVNKSQCNYIIHKYYENNEAESVKLMKSYFVVDISIQNWQY